MKYVHFLLEHVVMLKRFSLIPQEYWKKSFNNLPLFIPLCNWAQNIKLSETISTLKSHCKQKNETKQCLSDRSKCIPWAKLHLRWVMGHFKTCHWSVQVKFIDIAPSMTFSDAIKFFIWDKNLRKNLNKRYCHIVSLNFFMKL